jgi:hypothetical protein
MAQLKSCNPQEQGKAKCRGRKTMATTAAVQGAGLVTGVWKKLERAIFDAGGTEEHLARLDKAETDEAFANFAAEIVATIKVVVTSFREMIRAGRYDYTYGFADNQPEEIKGQTFHPVTNATELDHPATCLTTQQVFDRYGDKMASLSELLDYGIKNPETQRKFPIGIVWKVGDQFWYAYLDGDGMGRGLRVSRDRPFIEWSDDYRFLVRK